MRGASPGATPFIQSYATVAFPNVEVKGSPPTAEMLMTPTAKMLRKAPKVRC